MISISDPEAIAQGPRSWIFQANPKIFDLSNALEHFKVFRWTIRRHKNEVRANDRVFLWLSGPAGGLIARGTILTDPKEMAERPEEVRFYVAPEQAKLELRVELEVHQEFKPPIPRASLTGHPVLSKNAFVRASVGTNFPLSLTEAKALDDLCKPPPTFSEVMKSYRQDGTVYQSTERTTQYCVTDLDEVACEVTRLIGNEPDRCNLSGYATKLELVRENGGRLHFLNLDGTTAKRTTYLQGIELGLTPDKKEVLDLSDESEALANFGQLLGSLNVDRSNGPPRLYKPALMACVLDGLLAGELTENRITFDWVLPRFLNRMTSLGQEAGPQQAAYAYYSLANELFWMLCYFEPRQFISASSDASPGAIRERVRYAVLKDTYWRLLNRTTNCQALLRQLHECWWPDRPEKDLPNDLLAQAFRDFREEASEGLRVKVRRHRAEQIKRLVADSDMISLDQFDRDVWNFETSTLLDGIEIKGRIYGENTLSPSDMENFERALDEGRLELHGNYVWNPGSKIFGPRSSLNRDQKQDLVRDAFRILRDESLSLIDQVRKISDIDGFGTGTATGLVMLLNPDEFAVWNRQSKEALKTIGLECNELAAFQDSVRTLRERLGAEDYLELDWFLYLMNQGRIKIEGQVPPSPPVVPESGIRYWVMGLGEGGRLFKQCHKEGVIAIGWDELGNLEKYGNREDIARALTDLRGEGPRPTNDSLACYQFCRELKPGDIVFAKKGLSHVLGSARIQSGYAYDPSRPEYRHVRKVEWVTEGSWPIPEDARVPTKTLTDVTGFHKFLDFALPLLETPDPPRVVEQRPPFTIEQALDGLFLTKEEFQRILTSLARKKNAILQGPPGVGKTFIARRLGYALIGYKDPSKLAMVQFHQSYSYEDFIQGYRPNENGGFERRDGVFHQFCKIATSDPESNHVFIIDEINRGNLSKIFGELFQLIEADKRGPEFAIPLTYSKGGDETFHVPENVHILGMMNTADRSLAMVNFALRRRFTFVDLRPAFHTLGFQSFLEDRGIEADLIDLIKGRMGKLNEMIRSEKTNLGAGFEIGHSFFCPQGTEDNLDLEWYRSVIDSEIAPLLREYWFDDFDKAEELISKLLS